MNRQSDRMESGILRRINERRLLEAIHAQGPVSRASLTRLSGLTAPTVSKAVDALLDRGYLEEIDPIVPALGRPGRLVRMASQTAMVLGVVIDSTECCIVATGLDGAIRDDRTVRFSTPPTYDGLLDRLTQESRRLLAASQARPFGAGVSVPGLVNDRLGEVVMSPNLHMLDTRNPARDLEARLGFPCLLLQETDGLCLAERLYGDAAGLSDFAMLDVASGLGLGVMSGGELLAGHSGLAGEVGHVTVMPDGVRCGCGNRGCLETLATDAALVRLVSEQLGRPVDVAETRSLLENDDARIAGPLATVTEYLAIAISLVLNVFNPTALFVHGFLVAASEERFARVLELVRQRALVATLSDCRIRATKSSKRKGAVAGIIRHLTAMGAPTIR
jgi:N-acetylglucosamine repressor